MMSPFQPTPRRSPYALVGLSLSLMLALSPGGSLGAQTRFQRPDTAADLSRYQTPDECRAAIQRETGTFRARLPFWIDSTELVQREELQPLSAAATAAAKWCSEKFDPRTVALDAHLELVSMYLAAGRDDAADIVMERKLSLVRTEPKDSTSLIKTLDSIVGRLYDARPMRYQKIIELVHLMEAKGVSPGPRYTANTYRTMFVAADVANDSVTQQSYAKKLVTFADSLGDDDKQQRWYQIATRYDVTRALDYLAQRALLDSLRRSAESYIALKQANWARARGNNQDPLPAHVGQKAPPIRADYWYTRSPSNTTADHGRGPNATRSEQLQRPGSGKLALIVFLRSGCHDAHPGFLPPQRMTFKTGCMSSYAALRRMGERFPNLEITVHSSTTGYLAQSRPLEPQAEADLMNAWWLGYHRLPATLAVTNTSFFLLPGLDRRRIDNPVENDENYTFMPKGIVSPLGTYLVDPSGIILLSGSLGRSSEREFRRMIEVVTERMR